MHGEPALHALHLPQPSTNAPCDLERVAAAATAAAAIAAASFCCHQLHLHGQWFFIMSGGLPNAGDYNPIIHPVSGTLARDTVTVALKSYLVLRFVATNPGAWIFHCEGACIACLRMDLTSV